MTTPATLTAPLTAPLTADQLAPLEASVRGGLTTAIADLTRLREGGAHTAAGFDTWHAYVIDRFGDLLGQLRLTVTERREIVRSMRGSKAEGRPGVPLSTIAGTLGVSKSLVKLDVDATDAGDYPDNVIDLRGRTRGTRGTAPTVVAAPVQRRVDVLVARVTAHGPAGVTAQALEDELRWRHGSVSAALHRLATGPRARLTYLPPPKRGMHGRYTTATPAGDGTPS